MPNTLWKQTLSCLPRSSNNKIALCAKVNTPDFGSGNPSSNRGLQQTHQTESDMKATTKNAIGTFIKMTTKELNGFMFTSWRTPDNKHFYLVPAGTNINVIKYGLNPDKYEITYVLLGALNMVK